MLKKLMKVIGKLVAFLVCMFGPFMIGSMFDLMEAWYGIPMFLTLTAWFLIGSIMTGNIFLKSIGIDIKEMVE